ncbi:MAG: hypothetical protein ONB24_08105 [candidate division KSB1 bacterium]|nr:hypothetical protein [candidate division KSB1 bacterium]
MTEKDPFEGIIDQCPHCGRKLSPWERILLNVDRALMCKGCWFRIILDASDAPPAPTFLREPKNQDH